MTTKTTAPIRLNTYIRDAMVEKAVQTSGIAEEHRRLVEQRADFAEALRQHALSKAKVTDADLRKAIQQLQKDFDSEKPLADFLTVSPSWSSGERANYNLQGMNIYVYMDGRRPPKDSCSWNYDKTHLTDGMEKQQKDYFSSGYRFVPRRRPDIASPELADEFMSLEAAQKAVDDKETSLRATVGAAVKKFRTVDSMLEQWPEAKDLLPKELQPGTGLALSVADLNAICGIPTGDAEK